MKKLNHVLAFFQSLPVEKRINGNGKAIAIDFGPNHTLVWKMAGTDTTVAYLESEAADLVADLEKAGIEVPADVKAKVEDAPKKSFFSNITLIEVGLGACVVAAIGGAAFYFFGDAAVEAASEVVG